MDRELLGYGLLIVAAFLLASSALVLANAQPGMNDFPPETNTKFTAEARFEIPNNNGAVTFSSGGSYANATLNSGVWDFEGFYATGGLSMLPNIRGVRFSVSASNCEVTVKRLDVLQVVPPNVGQLDYTVNGVGSQAFNLHYEKYWLIAWTVEIDETAKAKGDGWTISANGWINVTGATSKVSIHWDQAPVTAFTAWTSFQIPETNGSIIFASQGSYWGEPRFENNTWSFQNLALDGLKPEHAVMWNLAATSQNCNVTITGYDPSGLTGLTNVPAWLNYTITGPVERIQRVNLNYGYLNNNIAPQGDLNLTVWTDGKNKPEGDGWRLLNDGWVEVTGAASNVSIYSPPNTSMNRMPNPSSPTPNLPIPTVVSSPLSASASISSLPTGQSTYVPVPDVSECQPAPSYLPFYTACAIIIVSLVFVAVLVARHDKSTLKPQI